MRYVGLQGLFKRKDQGTDPENDWIQDLARKQDFGPQPRNCVAGSSAASEPDLRIQTLGDLGYEGFDVGRMQMVEVQKKLV